PVTDDFFFKGAPLVIVVSGGDDVNPALASSYMEIMAESMGLGVLYSGFFRACADISGELQALLNLPEGHKVVTCMVIGYPSVKYRRIVPRKELKIKTL
ncbi:MAG: nitroreductase family protein, partial [Oscillospiraceae bacterium]|nr:nitroreductase family protein [Oscillospiraceae bacterium]